MKKEKANTFDYRGVRKVILRVVATWLINAFALVLMAALLADFNLGSLKQALLISAALGLMNALVWPFLARIALPITVLTLGFSSVIINGLFVFIAADLLQDKNGLYLHGWWTAVIIAAGVTAVNTLLTELFAINDDDFYYRHIVARQARRFRSPHNKKRPGIIFLEIDGLAHDILVRAFNDGSAPIMARWLRDGSHHLVSWECDWSSQSGAMQSGILFGSNWDMPAFRWLEKETGQVIVSNVLKDSAEIERRQSNGKGLLHYDGASRGNLFSGDAPHSMLTASTALDRNRAGKLGQDYLAFFTNPYSMLRTTMMMFTEIGNEIYQQIRQRRRHIEPRVHRGLFPYPLLRAYTNVLQRELNMSTIIQDVCAGRPVIYSTFLGYDEVAHHSGTERTETLEELEKIDREFIRLEKILEFAIRPYKVVILSDHGQSQGATFLQRYDESLGDLVNRLAATSTDKEGQGEEAWGFLSAMATELTEIGGFLSKTVRIVTRSKQKDGLEYGKTRDESGQKHQRDQDSDIKVLASGNLAGIYFAKKPGRLTLEQINKDYPQLIKGLKEHPGIGFMLVNSEKNGPTVISKDGTIHLDTNKVSGQNPLEPFGPNAAKHVARTHSFPHCPDIVVNSTYWPETEEVAAFEELVGSHGGMGGVQQFPFIFYPADLASPKAEIIGAESVHKQFRRWLIDLGWESYGK